METLYRIAICDDEPEICEQLSEILRSCTDVPELHLETYKSGEALCDAVERGKQFDLIILDIEFPHTNGVDIGRAFRKELDQGETQLLYISGKQQYAMQLFDLRPLNFLIKPLDAEKVCECLKLAVLLAKDSAVPFEYKYKKILHRIAYRQIRYFESKNKTVISHTVYGERVMSGQLSEVLRTEEIPLNFIQVHQSFIVNYDYVQNLGYQQLVLVDGTEIAISYPYRKKVQANVQTLTTQRRVGWQ